VILPTTIERMKSVGIYRQASLGPVWQVCVDNVYTSLYNHNIVEKTMEFQTTSTTINLRAQTDVRDKIDRAAKVQGKTRTDFILDASTAAAEQVLLDQVFFQVDADAMASFEAVMSRPLRDNTVIRELLASKSPWER
jgi:uncharacterized protein (DUF1778 family)